MKRVLQKSGTKAEASKTSSPVPPDLDLVGKKIYIYGRAATKGYTLLALREEARDAGGIVSIHITTDLQIAVPLSNANPGTTTKALQKSPDCVVWNEEWLLHAIQKCQDSASKKKKAPARKRKALARRRKAPARRRKAQARRRKAQARIKGK